MATTDPLILSPDKIVLIAALDGDGKPRLVSDVLGIGVTISAMRGAKDLKCFAANAAPATLVPDGGNPAGLKVVALVALAAGQFEAKLQGSGGVSRTWPVQSGQVFNVEATEMTSSTCDFIALFA